MIQDLLPAPAIGVDTFHDLGTNELFPEEHEQLRGAVEKRRHEYASVRYCARRLLQQIGVEPTPLPTGSGGAPTWPTGVVGSMTHCVGYRAAAVARDDELTAIGIDAEPNKPLPDEVWSLLTREEERSHILRLLSRHPAVWWDTLWFSAKEAVYKAWYPVMKTWLDFDSVNVIVSQASVSPGLSTGAFRATLVTNTEATSSQHSPTAAAFMASIKGRWRCERGLILTAAVVLPPHSVSSA